MAEQASLLQDGVDRFNEAVRQVDREIARLQKELRTRRRSLEKQVESGRKSLERRTRREVRRLRDELEKSGLVKRAGELRAVAGDRLEQGADGVLAALGIASRQDLERLDRKLSHVNRKLKELEKPRRSPKPGSRTPANA